MITASNVTYHNSFHDLKTVITCLIDSTVDILIYISDNSSNRDIERICNNNRIEYIYNNGNLGFGAAHNIAIKKAVACNSKYHFIINPDVVFKADVIQVMVSKMEEESNIGLMMPKILNIDGTTQNLPKLLPTPFNLLIRILKPLSLIFDRVNKKYLLTEFTDRELNVPILSGCFTLINLEKCKEIGFYDERFFMYFEDFDFSRKVHVRYKTLYYPEVSIIHNYERGASKSFRLFKIFIKSAISYFNKYGWLMDREKKNINQNILRKIILK